MFSSDFHWFFIGCGPPRTGESSSSSVAVTVWWIVMAVVAAWLVAVPVESVTVCLVVAVGGDRKAKVR